MDDAARGHFQAGSAYFSNGDLRRALSEFLAARGDSDRPELDYNIGLVYERLADAARAVSAYERFLARGDIEGDQRAEVEKRIADLRVRVGQLVVTTKVPDATIKLDEEILTPAMLRAPIAVTAGAHELSASKDGMFARREAVLIFAGGTLRMAIDPHRGRRPLAGWAVGLITLGSVLVAGAVVTGAVLGTRHGSSDYIGNANDGGVVRIKP
jgi:tetratricopeptide (TPR) repeat protein